MATKYRVYNELSEEEKAQITTEKQWRKRGYCPVENEGKLMYCNRSWSEAVYFRANQVRRMSEMKLALIRRRQKRKPATLPVLKGSDRMPNAYIELIDSLILQRQALKISQRELASAAGVSWTEVALMEQKKHMVQLRALLRIAAALNCKLVAVSVE